MTQPTIPLPQIDYEGAIAHGWRTLKIRQGSLACIAFARGAEWARDTMVADYAAACVQAERNDVHSCHANCQRAGCVNVRLRADRDSLADALADLVRAVEQSDATPTDRAWQAAEFARHVLGDKRA